MSKRECRAALLLTIVTLTISSAARADQVTTTTRLNLRRCPNTVNCSVIRTLPPGTQVELVGQSGAWYSVRVNSTGESGWLHSQYTKPVERSRGREKSALGRSLSIRPSSDFLLLGLGLILVVQPFYFVAKPSVRRLLLMFFIMAGFIITSRLLLNESGDFLLRAGRLYTAGTFFVLAFFFQHNVRLFYANALGFSIGYDDFSIPLIIWNWSEDFTFVNVLGIPVWRPLSYVRMLRSYYRSITSSEFARIRAETSGLTAGKSQVAVRGCRFQKVVRIDASEKQGDCFLVFNSSNQTNSPFLAFAKREILLVKPQRRREDIYKVSYIKRLGWAPKLRGQGSYDLFGTYSDIGSGSDRRPAIFLRAIRRHDSKSSINDLFVHWVASMIFLVWFLMLLLVSRQ